MADSLQSAGRAWPRVKWTRASQVEPLVGESVDLGAVAAMAPASAFAVLRGHDPVAATSFIAQCLSRADAVRWIATCLTEADATPPPARAVAAKAVRRWLAHPSDDARRLAFEAGAMAGWDTMEGMGCLAVFLSGGSMAPATQEVPVNPSPGVFGQIAAGAVLLAAHAGGAPAFLDTLGAMLGKADAIAAGEQPA